MPEQFDEQTFGQYAAGMKKDLQDYIQKRIAHARLLAQEQMAVQGGKAILLILTAFIAAVVFFFICITGAVYIGHTFKNYPLGFAIVSAFNLLLLSLMLIFKNQMRDVIAQKIAAGFLAQYPETEQEENPNNPNPNEQTPG